MENINDYFLEEYKHLDKILREMYSTERGVTAYIEDMKNVPPYESRAITNWNTDLQQLIRLRRLRNILAHECGTLNQEMCCQSDVTWLKDFYRRIFQRTDPIALLAKSRKKEQPKNTSSKQTKIVSSEMKLEDNKKYSTKFESVAMNAVLCLMVVTVCVIVLATVFKVL